MTGSGAEQDRFGGWFGGNKADQLKDAAQQHLPKGSGAEQDRFGGWFGGDKVDQVKDAAQQHMPRASGAEQDRLGGWFGGDKADRIQSAVREHMPRTSGAEQDRYGGHFSCAQAREAKEYIQQHMPQTSGAEQDRYAHWWGEGQADKLKDAVKEHMPKTSGAEQDRYGGWFGSGQADQAKEAIQRHMPKTSGAEQDRYGGWFGGDKLPSRAEVEKHLPTGSGAEQDRFGGWFGGHKGPSAQSIRDKLPNVSGAEQDRYGSHFRVGNGHYLGTTTVGLLQATVLPSFGLHTGLGAIAYGIGRYTDRAEAKDWLWPSGQVANAWWSAIGVPVVYGGLSISSAWAALSYDQKLLLTGVSAWGLRLFYRIASRSLRRGEDDARYVTVKREDPGFWNKAIYTMFLPEVIVQTLISLPFVLPFRAPVSSSQSSLSLGPPALSHSLAVFLFTIGYSAEILADWQLESHVQDTNNTTLNRSGVWSVVRHPNYLGDALCHFSFSVLAASAGLLHPLAALGPLVNYAFLRNIGGDRQNEEYQEARYAKENPAKYQQLQEYKRTKNSFWPRVEEFGNKWLWAVVGAGAAGVVLEQSFVNFLGR